MKRKKIAILGSTGSIGANALEVIKKHCGAFEVVSLAAGSNIDLLAKQIDEWRPKIVSVRDEGLAGELKKQVSVPVEIGCGIEGAISVATAEGVDLVVSAMVGAIGLKPTYRAILLGRTVALANKETLVIAGSIVMEAVAKQGAEILPVDSEHSAIFQALIGHRREDVKRIILTASGGPFLDRNDLSNITVEEALAHPRWSMGPKITIDSATMMNKGLEIIEAHHLFGLDSDAIDVVVHRESIIHSMVEYKDGSVIAQMGWPDMRTPISYALGYPSRLENDVPGLDWERIKSLTFSRPDNRKFPFLGLAREVIRAKGSAPVVMNAANEIAVNAFLNRRIGFTDIYRVVSETLQQQPITRVDSLDEVLEIDREARLKAEGLCI